MLLENTIALWTPPGRSAIATLVVQGPETLPALRDVLRRPGGRTLPTDVNPGRILVGKLGEGSIADAVVVAVKENSVEIHCHGGPEVIRFICELFIARGFRLAAWFEQRAVQGTPAWKVELEACLSQAPTLRTANILLDQLGGTWERWTERVQQAIAVKDPVAGQLIDDCLRFEPLGRHLVEPWKVVVAGAPNVGKSSLINAIAGYERSVVSPLPGTTRDVISSSLAIDGWPIQLFDTAGLRETSEDLERAGAERAQAAVAEADLCLWVVDASSPPIWPAPLPCPVLRIINKMDLPAVWDLDTVADAQKVAARTGAGVAELCQRISATLVPQYPRSGDALPFSPEAVRELRQWQGRLKEG